MCTNLGKILVLSMGQQGGWGAERQAAMKVWVVSAGKLPKF